MPRHQHPQARRIAIGGRRLAQPPAAHHEQARAERRAIRQGRSRPAARRRPRRQIQSARDEPPRCRRHRVRGRHCARRSRAAPTRPRARPRAAAGFRPIAQRREPLARARESETARAARGTTRALARGSAIHAARQDFESEPRATGFPTAPCRARAHRDRDSPVSPPSRSARRRPAHPRRSLGLIAPCAHPPELRPARSARCR